MTAPIVIATRYALIRLLGEGGMGAVYEAEHLVTHRRVALKLLHPDQAWTPAMIDRFIREAQIAAAIGHPNIIDVLDAGLDDGGAPFLVFEYLQGTSVGGLLEAGPLAVDRALAIIADVLDALVAAHARGVLHRDIKPDNVFLATDARDRTTVKLLDFGIARAVTDLGLSPHQRTQTGMLMGTPAYMSPEQVRGLSDVDALADVWSVGVMLFEMLSGVLPFQADNINALMFAVATDPMVPLASVAPGVPAPVVAIVERALVKERAGRTPSSSAMLAQIQQVRADLGLMERPSTVPSLPPPPASSARDASDIGSMPTALNVPTPSLPEKSTLDPHETFPPIRGVSRRSVPLALGVCTVALIALGALVLRPAARRPLPPSLPAAVPHAASPPPTAPTPDAGVHEDAPLPAAPLHVAEAPPPGHRPRGARPRAVHPPHPAAAHAGPYPTPPLHRAGIRPVTGFDGL